MHHWNFLFEKNLIKFVKKSQFIYDYSHKQMLCWLKLNNNNSATMISQFHGACPARHTVVTIALWRHCTLVWITSFIPLYITEWWILRLCIRLIDVSVTGGNNEIIQGISLIYWWWVKPYLFQANYCLWCHYCCVFSDLFNVMSSPPNRLWIAISYFFIIMSQILIVINKSILILSGI